jgi:hypothetical protein
LEEHFATIFRVEEEAKHEVVASRALQQNNISNYNYVKKFVNIGINSVNLQNMVPKGVIWDT